MFSPVCLLVTVLITQCSTLKWISHHGFFLYIWSLVAAVTQRVASTAPLVLFSHLRSWTLTFIWAAWTLILTWHLIHPSVSTRLLNIALSFPVALMKKRLSFYDVQKKIENNKNESWDTKRHLQAKNFSLEGEPNVSPFLLVKFKHKSEQHI